MLAGSLPVMLNLIQHLSIKQPVIIDRQSIKILSMLFLIFSIPGDPESSSG
jgi:hypothetical protein